jgi:NDP-sugar pyrophosphorylase family protein
MMAVVLAGGKGTRLNADRPKCLVEVAGKPCIDWVVENLEKNGILDVIQYWDYNEGGTAGVLKPKLTDPFIVCNGDTITNVNIKEMYKLWNQSRVEAVLFNPQLDDISHNGGTYIFTKSVLDKIDKSMDIPELVYKLDSLQIYSSDAYYYDIGTPEKLAKARSELKH